MSRLWSMVIGLNLLACTANAQWMYPRGLLRLRDEPMGV